MARALEVAAQGRGSVSPNPMVGAVLVKRGAIIAEGFHPRFGGPHAERRLLSGMRPRDLEKTELFLTLEPCSYHGKTPPCVEALLASPIPRITVATRDPNPKVCGRGIAALRRARREVRVGLLGSEARALNRPFFLSQQEGRARISLKIASTLDGKLADESGGSKWITGPEARAQVARLRGMSCALVVGRGTVEQDDPRLTSARRAAWSPTRIVLDSRLSIDPNCRLARLWRRQVGKKGVDDGVTAGNWILPAGDRAKRWRRRPRLIVATNNPSKGRLARFRRCGWEVWSLPARDGSVDLGAFSRRAAAEGLIDLLVEPGPTLAGSFLTTGPVDRLLLFVAPKITGGPHGWGDRCAPRELVSALATQEAEPVQRFGADHLFVWTGRGGSAIVDPQDASNRLHSS